MPVTDVKHDPDTLSLTITADFAAPVDRIWEVYSDARQLERVWGPPTYPATFVDHELAPGTRSTYFMTSPDGEKFAGYWDITETNGPHGFSFDDGFADLDFNPNPEMPVGRNVFTFTEHDGGTRATYVAIHTTAEDLQRVLDMGMAEGMTEALNQIDDLVA